jgi:tellurite methyltransferase
VTSEWSAYYAAATEEPRQTLLDALDRFDEPGLAVDLGCGTGRDTRELLRRGWRVLAVDAEEEAVVRLRAQADAGDRLETRVARMEDASLPEAQLVNSSFALPFCPAERFGDLWDRIVASLPSGGRFSGQLFGVHDEWAPGSGDMTFHTRAEVERLLEPFVLERLSEVDEDGRTALGEAKHWHVFHVVARRR